MQDDLALALELADVADSVTLPRFRALDLAVETKPDLSPVTEADRVAERALREVLAKRRPEDGVLGEELGETRREAARRWILDPIDGTKNYSRGIPVWGTLIALEHGGDVVVGVASAPALRRRWWATLGGGAFADGAGIAVSDVARVEEAVLSFDRSALVLDRERVLRLVDRCWHLRAGADCWQHLLVAEGGVDVALDHIANVWDVAAIKVIVEEAGGRVTDLSGEGRIDGGSAISTNGLLHDEVLAALGSDG